MAIEINGRWKKGFALDLHTASSEYLGQDEYGHDQYETKRTEIGEYVYQLKYKRNLEVIPYIINKIKKLKGIEKFDLIIPVPPSKSRDFQPVYKIGEALSKEYNIKFMTDAFIRKTGTEEIKNIENYDKRIELLKKTILANKANKISGMNILLLDDLYRSGATLNCVTDILYDDFKVKMVCVITLTKTRSKR